MANILGYAERGEGGGAFDIGGALTGAAQKIQQANIAEDQRRQELTDKYDAAKRKVESYESGKSKGFNNWMQEQITKVKDQMYTDFQALKKSRGRNDSAYRRKMSNIDSSWSMLAKRAKDWNTHYEKGLQQVSSGEGSDYMAFLLGEDSKIGDFGNLDMNIDEDGNMNLQGIDKDTGAIFNRSLTSIMAPENSFDESLNTSDALIEMTKALPKTKLWDEKTKQYVEDKKLSPAFNEQRLRNVEANTSNPRAIAKWYSGLYDHQVSFVTSVDQRIQKANDYLASDIGRMSVKQRADELHQAAKTAGKAGYTMAQAQADAEMQILGEQQMLMVSSAEDKNNISNPQFQGHSFTIPPAKKDAQGNEIGGRPMTITYNKINPDTGNVEEVTKTFQPGDEVNIGDMQHSRVRSGIYEGQSTMSGRIESGKKTKTPKAPKPPSEDEKTKIEANKEFYTTVADAARGDVQGYILASNGRIKSIQKDHNGKEGEEYREELVINTKDGLKRITVPVKVDPTTKKVIMKDGEPEINYDELEEELADILEGGKAKAGTGRLKSGKAAYGKYEASEGETPKYKRYGSVRTSKTPIHKPTMYTSAATAYKPFQTEKPDKKGNKVITSMNSSEAMDVLMGQNTKTGSRGKDIEKDTEKYFNGFGRIPSEALEIKSDIGRLYGSKDTSMVTIKSPYTGAAPLNIALIGHTDDADIKNENLELSELGFEYYHTREKSRRNQITKKVNDIMPCREVNINGKTTKVKANKVAGSFVPCK